MKSTVASLIVVFTVLATSAHAAPVTLFTNQTAFETATNASTVPIPGSTYFPSSCGTPSGQTGAGATITLPFGSNQMTITNATGSGLCIFDAGAVIPDDNTVPALMIANTIVGNGEDDYAISFLEPINSIGFRLLTNRFAQETFTFTDATNNIIASLNVDAFTDPNTRQFVGFQSTIPIGSILLDTTGGAGQNEGFDLVEVGGQPAPVPEPGTITLVASGVAALVARRRRAGPAK